MKQLIILMLSSMLFLQFTCNKQAPEGGELEEKEWHLVQYTVKQQQHIPIGKNPATIRLEGGQVSGSGSCNGYFGSYSLNGVNLQISSIGATEMACPLVMDQEQAFFQLLENAETYTSKDNTLTIYAKKGSLVFKSAP